MPRLRRGHCGFMPSAPHNVQWSLREYEHRRGALWTVRCGVWFGQQLYCWRVSVLYLYTGPLWNERMWTGMSLRSRRVL